MTYNRYVTEGIKDGTIKEMEYCGVRVYKVRRPTPDEMVMGNVSTTSILVPKTPTEQSEYEGRIKNS